MNIYNKEYLDCVDEIPIFTPKTSYSENYDNIANVAIKSFKETGQNPFMEEQLWEICETETFQLTKKYMIDSDKKILDVGVGTGRLLSYFEEIEKYGIDISIDMAIMSKEKNIEVCVGNVEELPYKDNTFDIVLCTDVLEHVIDINKTIKEIYRVLNVGGVFVVRVPYNEDLTHYMAKTYPFEYVHLRTFTESELICFLKKVFRFKYLNSKLIGTIHEKGQEKSYEVLAAFTKGDNSKRLLYNMPNYKLLKDTKDFSKVVLFGNSNSYYVDMVKELLKDKILCIVDNYNQKKHDEFEVLPPKIINSLNDFVIIITTPNDKYTYEIKNQLKKEFNVSNIISIKDYEEDYKTWCFTS